MEDKQEIVRPTKKQQQLLEYISKFIEEHGYGPSYREIMVGCNYTSVATVAVHVRNLITRGHLKKNGRSARSLEIIGQPKTKTKLQTTEVSPSEEKWLVEKVDYLFAQKENDPKISEQEYLDLQKLVEALKVLGIGGASVSFSARLNKLKAKIV